eukprot:CAMPEP_0196654120 /NCGR_PEP_ID=MMETSP1086-20130531/3802_1 /TAXON_ID=77921 /ORGANISM="Cyanoptyche  gloeocystis , Strain SAG4.97" /LENGTH=136 /DNA_ID=CAMNT_0041985693 /DNA_START=912 /DNA_END=1322 /DNA_ORIENTATION=+
MDVEVIYGLPAREAVVDHESVTVLQAWLLPCNLGRGAEQVAHDGVVLARFDVGHPSDELLRHQHDVHRRLRVHVPEGEHLVVFKNNFGRDFLPNNLAEDGVCLRIRRRGSAFLDLRHVDWGEMYLSGGEHTGLAGK